MSSYDHYSREQSLLGLKVNVDSIPVVLGGIIFLLLVYGITNSERYSVFHGI